MLTRLLAILYSVLTVSTVFAQQRTYAVVVGISDYRTLSSRNGDLRFADRDARQVASFLRSKAGGSILTSRLRLLTNQQATLSNVRQALTLFEQAKAGDRIILYFSGHGSSDSFVPYDVQPGDERNFLTHRDVKAAFHLSGASTKLCIADACLSGSMTQREDSQRNLAKTLVNPVSDSSNVAMLLASRSMQNAIEAGRLAGGVFTYYLLKGLTGEADRDANRIVTIRELHQYVATKVRRATGGRQTPVFYGRFSDNLALAYL